MIERAVLDYGKVSYDLTWKWGSEIDIYNTAAVCMGKSPVIEIEQEKLFRFFKSLLCRTPAHESPFEFAGFKVEIVAPIFVARQLHRHRMTSIMERSMRYNETLPQYYTPELDPRALQEYEFIMQNEINSYKTLLGLGLPKEQARGVLGTAFYTQWQLQANLREWMHILYLRKDLAAQYETRQYANTIGDLFCLMFPNIYDAWTTSLVEKRS